MRILVAGGGLAALRTVENLRRRGYEESIVVIAEEAHMPYDRPPLSKEILTGDTAPERLEFGVSPEAGDVQWRLGATVHGVDLAAKTLTVSPTASTRGPQPAPSCAGSGAGGYPDDKPLETLEFDGLVAATGVSSRRLPIPGPYEGRSVLRSRDDAARLKASLRPGKRIVSLGAGFIGCEVARTALAAGCSIDIVALDDQPMQVPLGDLVGAELKARHQAAGVRFHMGRTIVRTLAEHRGGVESLESSDSIRAVELDDGTVLGADLLLETVGSVPNTSWLAGNGLDLANGVLTDEYLRCGGVPGAVAVGDIARFANPLFAAPPLRIEHRQTAIDTAVVASATLLYDLGVVEERPAPVNILPWFWSDQGDVHLTSVGQLGLADETVVIDGALDGECAVWYRREGLPVGVLLIGMKQRAARFKRQLVQERRAAV